MGEPVKLYNTSLYTSYQGPEDDTQVPVAPFAPGKAPEKEQKKANEEAKRRRISYSQSYRPKPTDKEISRAILEQVQKGSSANDGTDEAQAPRNFLEEYNKDLGFEGSNAPSSIYISTGVESSLLLKPKLLDKYNMKEQYTNASEEQRKVLLDNLMFKDVFSSSSMYNRMKNLPKEERDKLLEDYILDSNILKKYPDATQEQLSRFLKLQPESKKQLLESDYMTSGQFEEHLTKEEEKYLGLIDTETTNIFRAAGNAAIASGYPALLKAKPERRKENQNILDNIIIDDSDRKIEAIQPEIERQASILADQFISGEVSMDDLDSRIKDIYEGKTEEYKDPYGGTQSVVVNPPSGMYLAFKDDNELAMLTPEDKIKMIATYEATNNAYGVSDAVTARDVGLQRYIADKQNFWDGFEDVTMGILSKFTAHIMQGTLGTLELFGAGMQSLASGDNTFENYLQGKDRSGNDLPAFFNPNYWSRLDQYGVWSPTAQNDIITKYGGWSPRSYVLAPGEITSTGQILREAGKMTGYVAADVLMNYAAGALAGGKAASQAASKAAATTTAVLGASAIGQAYGTGVFDTVMQETQGMIDETKAIDLERYLAAESDKFDFSLDKNGNVVGENDYSKNIAEDVDLVATNQLNEFLKENGKTPEDIGKEKYLELKESFVNTALNQYLKHLSFEYDDNKDAWLHDYDKMEEYGKERAVTGFLTSYAIETIRYSANAFGWRKFLMTDRMKSALSRSKGVKALFDSKGNPVPTYDMGIWGSTANEKLFKAFKVGQAFWGSGLSNFNDDLTTAYATQLALHPFNDMMTSGYDPDKYLATSNTLARVISSMQAGTEGVQKAFVSPQSWNSFLIGSFGMIGPSISLARSETGRYNSNDVAREASKAKMGIEDFMATEKFNALVKNGTIREKSAMERFHDKSFLTIPLMQSFYDAQHEIDINKNEIDNQKEMYKVILKSILGEEENVDAINNIVTRINEAEAAELSGNEVDARDARARAEIYLALSLKKSLEKGSGIEEGNIFLQRQQQQLEDIIDGNISQEEKTALISEFLENVTLGNTPVKEDNSIANKEQYAWERIQENAKRMLDTQKEYAKIYDGIKKSQFYKEELSKVANEKTVEEIAEILTANQMLEENREKRSLDMEQEIRGIAAISETTSNIAEYGSKRGLKKAIQEQEGVVKELEMSIQDLQEKVSTPLTRKQRRNKRTDALRRVQEATLKMRKEELQEAREKLEEMKQDETDFSKVLTAEEIINLNPEQRAKILNPENFSNYSKKQQREINKANDTLRKKGMGLIKTVQDAATVRERNRELAETNRRMLSDTKSLADYLQYLSFFRNSNLEDREFYRAYRIAEQQYQKYTSEKGKINFVKKYFNERGLDKLIKDHAEDKGLLENLRPIIRLRDNSLQKIGLLMPEEVHKDSRKFLAESINSILSSPEVTNEEQALRAIERFAEEQTDSYVRSVMSKLLEGLKNLNYQIKATIPESEAAKEEIDELKAQADAQKAVMHNRPVTFNIDTAEKNRISAKKLQKKGITKEDLGATFKSQEGQISTEELLQDESTNFGISRIDVLSDGTLDVWVYAGSNSTHLTKDNGNPLKVVNALLPKRETNKIYKALETYKNAQERTTEKDIAPTQSEPVESAPTAPVTPTSTENAPVNPVTPTSTEGAPLASVAPAGVEQAPVKGVPPASTEDVTPAAIPPASDDFTVPSAVRAQFDRDGKLMPVSEETQAALAAKEAGTEVLPLDKESSEDAANESEEQSDTLLGNFHSEYDNATLRSSKVQTRKTPKAKNNSLDRFFQWADSKGLKVQKTIDEELGNIVRKFPDTKIQFMVVRGDGASDAMRNNIVLVTEYTEGVAKLHSQENGEPIQVGNKQYLVIGTLGFSQKSTAQQNSFNRIKGIMTQRANSVFNSSSAEYYVDEQLNTKVSKIYAGFLVRQQAGEDTQTSRTLGELFGDAARNPGKINFNNAIFGIVFGEKGFVPSRNASETIYSPGLSETNQGRVFIMVKAANGNYIPVALKRVTLAELKENSKLKEEIENVLGNLLSDNLSVRKRAIERLSTLLVLDGNNNILVGSKDANTVSLVRNGNIVRTWTLGKNFNGRFQFMSEVMQTPFIVNLTMRVLKNPTELKKYDAAGALIVDVSTLGTVGASFSVYNIDSEGNPIEVKTEEPAPKQKKTEPVYEKSAPINGKTYRKVGDTIVDENGKPVDENNKEGQKLAASARYTMMIDGQRLAPIGHGEKFSYYMINQNLVVVRDANNNCEVVVGAKARRIIEGFEAQRAKLEREEAARKEAEKIKAEQEAARKELEEKPAVERAAEIQIGLGSITRKGFSNAQNSDVSMPEYSQHLSSPTHQTSDGRNVSVWSENGTTYFAVEGSGRTGNSWSFSVNRTLTGEQITDLISAVEGMSKFTEIKQAVKEYLTDQPKVPTTPPIPEAPKEVSQPSGKAPTTVKNTEKSYKFVELIQTKRRELNDIAKEKGWNWGSTPAEKAAFLVKLGILKNVGEEITMSMDSFCQMLKNCK